MVAVGLLAGVAGLSAPASVGDAPLAPGHPGAAADWSPGDKDGFGTAVDAPASKVWYTLNSGALSEVFSPRIDTPGTRDTQLVVSDGSSFSEREDVNTTHRTELLDDRALTYQQVNTARSGRYRVTKTYVTDPDRSAVLVDVLFESLSGHPYDVYVLHDAGLGLNANDDIGWSSRGGLLATDGVQSSAVLTSPGFAQTSSGYAERSDGWSDVRDDHQMDWSYNAKSRGNVVQMGKTRLTGLAGAQRLTLALGFGERAENAADTAARALRRGFASARRDYQSGWHDYLAGLRPAPASARAWEATYHASAMVLAASEDKTYRGGFVASPGRPWAWANSLQRFSSYYAVWSRDLYEIATALIAMGDRPAAERALDHLWRFQQRNDGSFPQNARLDGEPVFGGLQKDEVAFPIILAWDLGRTGAADWQHVRRSADFLVAAKDPRTGQERWENNPGFSPATIATEIAGLVCASDIAMRNGDTTRMASYLATADEWQKNVEQYTVTTNGPLSTDPYYLRITANGDADTGATIQIADGGPAVDQRQVVDPSFLEVVRLGVKSADDPNVLSTVRIVDRELGYDTDHGPFWYRSSFDGYGEKSDGSQWENVPQGSRQTVGRGWPLLTGERGEYDLALGRNAQRYLDTMARSADDSTHLLAEQVWDHQPPADRDPRFIPGRNTASATPLAWAHAQFIRLAHSIDAGHPVETPQVVACRYHTTLCR